jgi:hypothetical protein
VISEGVILVGQENVLAVDESETFDGERRRDNRKAVRHRLEDLDPRSAAGRERYDGHVGSAVEFRQVRRIGDDLDGGIRGDGKDIVGRRAACNDQSGSRKIRSDKR